MNPKTAQQEPSIQLLNIRSTNFTNLRIWQEAHELMLLVSIPINKKLTNHWKTQSIAKSLQSKLAYFILFI